MIAVDTNILVYAHREESPWHEPAKAALTGLIAQGTTWAVPWPCLHEFLAVVTNPRILRPPSSWEDGFLFLDGLEQTGLVRWVGEGPGYWTIMRALGGASKCAGGQVHDARIAAICRFHGIAQLWSADRDFSRFPEVVVRNPLVA